MVVRSILTALFLLLLPLAAQAQEVVVHVFWQQGCPYCQAAKQALGEIAARDAEVIVRPLELGPDPAINALFGETAKTLGIRTPAVPLVVIGGRHVLGYSGEATARQYSEMIAFCRSVPCRNLVAELQSPAPPSATAASAAPEGPDTVTLPWGKDVTLTGLSLPVLTVVLAAVDGFNPCAMWVLALLIGLLLGVEDSRRMWTLGIVFLLATGVMYFAVMSAWLSVVLWLGAVVWLRLAIGALAVGAGVYYLREYWVNPEGVCKVTPGQRKRRISQAFGRLVATPSLLVASAGVAALAVGVNLIELVCSAGVPAVFTQMLSMHDLPLPTYYGYILLYLLVFLLDDMAIFVIAMVTLRSVAATGRFSRLSHLVGGVVLLALGAIMILRPDLLG